MFFFLNTQNSDHLIVICRFFFVLGVFQNVDFDFWPLLKTEKVLPQRKFGREKMFSSKPLFSIIHIYESINFLEKSGPLLQPY